MYRREVNGPFRELKIGLLIGSGLLPIGHEVARRRSSSEFDERRRQSLGSPTRRVRSSNRASSRNRRDLDLQTDQLKMMLFDCIIKPVECHVPLAQCSMDSDNQIRQSCARQNDFFDCHAVRPTSSVRKYAASEQDPVAAGRELAVDAVLNGSVQTVSNRIRVVVQLVNVREGSALWGESFDGELADIFTVQDRISEHVAGALKLSLSKQKESVSQGPRQTAPKLINSI